MAVLGAVWALGATPGLAWDSYTFDLPSGAKESLWRDELARRWHGETEHGIEGGRIDVLTEKEAIEVEFIHKWHEGVGQALHYGSATKRQGVLAIVVSAQSEDKLLVQSRQRLELIEGQCVNNGLRMIVLFPNRGEEFPHLAKQAKASSPR